MAKYHISEDGNPRVCRASKNPCRYGGDYAHYSSKEEAREAYEVTQEALASMSNDNTWDYDTEELSVLNRMKKVLKEKHDWEDADFAGMTFTDVESEYLDTYGEPDFRPTGVQADEEYLAYSMVEDAERAFSMKHNLSQEFKGKLYRLQADLDGIDEDYEYMAHKPATRKVLADRLRETLRAYEEEWDVIRNGGKSPLRNRVREKRQDRASTAALFNKMEEQKFFVNARQKAEAFYDLENNLGEHWYSNGAQEFKIFNEGNGVFRFYNFRNIDSVKLDDYFTE